MSALNDLDNIKEDRVDTSPKAKRHRESAHDRIHALGNAARGLIVEKGLDGLRTRDVAERVGINIATLHYHVPTKDALIVLVAKSVRDEFCEKYYTKMASEMTGAECLRIKMDGFLDVAGKKEVLTIVMFELIELSRRNEAVSQILENMRKEWIASVEGILTRGHGDGSIRKDITPFIGANLIVSTLLGLHKLPKNSAPDWRMITNELERLFIV